MYGLCAWIDKYLELLAVLRLYVFQNSAPTLVEVPRKVQEGQRNCKFVKRRSNNCRGRSKKATGRSKEGQKLQWDFVWTVWGAGGREPQLQRDVVWTVWGSFSFSFLFWRCFCSVLGCFATLGLRGGSVWGLRFDPSPTLSPSWTFLGQYLLKVQKC